MTSPDTEQAELLADALRQLADAAALVAGHLAAEHTPTPRRHDGETTEGTE